MRWLSQRAEEEGTLAWAVGWHPLIVPSPPLPPHLSSLRPLDLEFLQRLCRAVNVVPVIARADSLTIEEREAFRHVHPSSLTIPSPILPPSNHKFIL